jgi:hypothetical protein
MQLPEPSTATIRLAPTGHVPWEPLPFTVWWKSSWSPNRRDDSIFDRYYWQREFEHHKTVRIFPVRAALTPDRPAMRVYDFMSDGQTETCATRLSLGEKRIEQFWKIFFRNLRAVVTNRKLH